MLTQSDLTWLKDRYQARGHNNDTNKGGDNLGFGYYHYAMIRNLKPEHVLAVGSQRGFAPAVMAMACRDNGFGLVHFVDAALDYRDPKDNVEVGKKSWGGIGLWKEVGMSYWGDSGLIDYLAMSVMTTEEYHRLIHGPKNNLAFKRKYGYIYLDGDHSYEGVKRDFELFRPHLAEGGILTMHDIDVDRDTDWGICGVKKFWSELEEPHKMSLDFECGLGIVQARGGIDERPKNLVEGSPTSHAEGSRSDLASGGVDPTPSKRDGFQARDLSVANENTEGEHFDDGSYAQGE